MHSSETSKEKGTEAKLRVLVFAAHPDDAEFGAGGTLIRLSARADITLCTLTDGGAGTYGDAKTRRAEQEAAAAILRAKLLWLNKPDCSVEYTRALAFELAQIIRDEQPDIVMVPHWNQQGSVGDGKAHPDHRHIGLTVRDATRFARFRIPQLSGDPHAAMHVWYYMLPSTLRAAVIVPIDDAMPQLRALWNAHKSQLAIRDGQIVDLLLRGRASAAEHLRGVQFAELLDSDAPISVDMLTRAFGSFSK